MQFPYCKFPSLPNDAFPEREHVRRPVIPIELRYNEKIVKYLALIDSGADFCIFHAEIGEYLGINIRDGKRLEFFGVIGDKKEAFFHEVSITVGGNERKSYCGFSYEFDVNKMPYGILGQKGFFDLFKVSMDYGKEQIELKPKDE